MLREIRGVDQRDPRRCKRWFQDDYFELFLWQDDAGTILEFQLCYRRDTRQERILDWRRGRGMQHLKPESLRAHDAFLEDDSWALRLDGAMPYLELTQHFVAASGGLPPKVARFVREKIDAHTRPPRRFRPRNARVPRWLERLREQRRRASSTGILDTESDAG